MEDGDVQTEGREILKEIREELEMCGMLYPAMEKTGVFPEYALHMTEIGEQTGRLDETMEGEEPDQSNRGQAGDKASLELPGCQQRLLQAVAAVGKPVITVILSGSAMDLRYADANTNAVLQAWYPGAEGGTAVADILFWKGITKRKASGYIL